MSYLTDKFGMTYYTIMFHKYDADGDKDLYKEVVARDSDGVVIKNHAGDTFKVREYYKDKEKREAYNNKRFAKWVAWEAAQPTRHLIGHGMPRTIRDIKMIQARIDGVVGWYNVR